MKKETIVKAAKTTHKPQKRGKKDLKGVLYSADNQPTSEAKKKGWEQWRKERHLTQAIIKHLISDKDENGEPIKFNDYIQSLVTNAKLGNPKAIDAVNKCLEEEVIKVAATNAAGEDAKVELTNQQYEKLFDALTKPG